MRALPAQVGGTKLEEGRTDDDIAARFPSSSRLQGGAVSGGPSPSCGSETHHVAQWLSRLQCSGCEPPTAVPQVVW